MRYFIPLYLLFGIIPFLTFSQSRGLEYVSASNSNLDHQFMKSKVDSIMSEAIKQKAFPGAQVLVAHKGQIVFHEAYGFHTYDNNQEVALEDIYDLASVTKIIGPLPALMKLYEEGKLNLDVPFSTYWKSWRSQKNKKNITLRELLSHQSGLDPYITFLRSVIKGDRIKQRFVKTTRKSGYSKQVFRDIYIKDRFDRKMYRVIKRADVSENKTYKYSGIASLIYPKLIEELTGQSYESYLNNNFYKPLGTKTITYNPSTKNFSNKIVPTEIDTLFRKALVKGYVHDENAALLGGVSGNAGLFATAKDLAIYMQMLLQKGEYNGIRYFKPATVDEFTRAQYPENNNRRGLGFDKPVIGNDSLTLSEAYPAPKASDDSFGHSGFTGTLVWTDPQKELVFIFLSNRVHPSRTHRNIYNLNVRPALMEVFYKAIEKQIKLTNN